MIELIKKKNFQVIAIIIIIIIFLSIIFILPRGASASFSSLNSNGDYISNIFGLTATTIGNCTPSGNYDACFSNFYQYYDAVASTKIQTYQYVKSDNNLVNGKFVGNAYVDVKFSGTKFYVTDQCFGSWSAFDSYANCGEFGCYGQEVSSTYRKTWTQNYNGCFVAYSWDKDFGEKIDGVQAWATTTNSYGWLEPMNLQFVDCGQDSDCEYNEYCSKQNTCEVKECDIDINGILNPYVGNSTYCSSLDIEPERACIVDPIYHPTGVVVEKTPLPICNQNTYTCDLKSFVAEKSIEECKFGCEGSVCKESTLNEDNYVSQDYSIYFIIPLALLVIIIGGVLWIKKK